MKRAILICGMILFLCVMLTSCTRLENTDSGVISVYASAPHMYSMTALLLDGVENARLKCLFQPFDGMMNEREITEWELYLLAYDADVLVVNGNGFESYLSSLPALDSACPIIIDSSSGISYDVSEDKNSDVTTDEYSYMYLSPTYAEMMMRNIADGLITVFPQDKELVKTNLESAIGSIDVIMQDSAVKITGKNCAVLCSGLECFLSSAGVKVSYVYSREPGTSISDHESDIIYQSMTDSGTETAIIENYAPEKTIRTLEEKGVRVIKLDLMESSSALETPYTILLENNVSLLSEGLAE